MPGWINRTLDSVVRHSSDYLRERMSKLSTRLSLVMMLMVILTAGFIEIVTLYNIESETVIRARQHVDAQVMLLADGLDGYIDSARADLRSFRAAAALDGIVRARVNNGTDPIDDTDEKIWRSRMAARFSAELAAKPLYRQFRIVGVADGGREIVHVGRSGPNNSIRIIADEDLQQKGDTYYMAATTALKEGDVYVSPIDLNRENNEIKQQNLPVLRVATPIHADNGTLFGILIINLDMQLAFSRIRQANLFGGYIFIVNDDGDYLLHKDKSREFGFEYGRPYRIQDDYPAIATLLNSSKRWDGVITDITGEAAFSAAARIKLSDQANVTIVNVVPLSVIMAPVSALTHSVLMAGLVATIIAALIALLIARSLTRPLRQITAAVQAFGRNEPMAVPVTAVGEIGLLAQTFERMAADIRRDTGERRRIFETSLDLIIIVDRRGRLIRVSPSSMPILGYRPEEMIGHNAAEYLYREDLENTQRQMRLSRRGRLMRNFETRYVHKDGRIVTLAWTGTWSEPESQHYFIGRDVTGQKIAEGLFKVAVEACPSGMMMIDRDGGIVMVNTKVERLFGYRREELVGQPIEILVPADLRSDCETLRGELNEDLSSRNVSSVREVYGLRKDGIEIPIEIDINTVHVHDGILILASIVDIADRKLTERIKDDFVSTVSHELRTPLTSISASLALLSAGRAGHMSEAAARLIDIAHSNGLRLVRLINDILDIEKFESGKMLYAFTQVDARAVAEQVVETNLAYAENLGVKIRLDAELIVGKIRADADRLAQVITNLVSNAIKFSPPRRGSGGLSRRAHEGYPHRRAGSWPGHSRGIQDARVRVVRPGRLQR